MADAVILEHKDEFRRLLEHYRTNPDAQKLFEKLRFVVLNGVTGGGRNTVINYLVQHDNYHFIISDTTRPPKVRDGKLEQNGVNYWFRKEDEMLADIRAGWFLEAELIHDQQVSGTSLREFERALELDKTAIAEVEFGGANNIAELVPNAFIIGLLPPNYDEWMRRLRGREEMSEQEFFNRMRTAQKVLQNMLDKPFFHIVINDTAAQCAADIQSIVVGTYSEEREARGRRVAQELLREVDQILQPAAQPR